jgi:hypothetical protein
MRHLPALLILALPLLAGCGAREHLNPFDPANPQTHGRPAGFEAIAGNQTVLLRWQPTSASALVGYQVFRLAPGDTAYRPLTGLLPPSATSAQDFGLLNGADHRYRLYYVFADGPGAAPAEDVATPGPLRPWVADYGGGTLARLSADGRHVAQVITPPAGGDPYAVDVSPADGRVWAVGPGSDVLVYDPSTGLTSLIAPEISSPVSVVVSRSDSAAWVGDGDRDLVEHLRPSGAGVPPPILTGLAYPGSLALDASRGSLWVVEMDGGRVRRYSASGGLAATIAVSQPSRIAVDPVTGEAWVTSLTPGTVLRISSGGAALDTVTACTGPLGVAVDPVRRRIWVADAAGDQVVALSPDGAVEFRVAGLAEPREIAVDPTTGEAWVSVAKAGAVARLSPAGHEILRVGGLKFPTGIALDDVSGRP